MLPSSLVNGSAVWLAHPSVYPALRLLTLAVGTGGSALPMLQGNARQGWTLNGIELVFSEKCAAIGTVGDLSLLDFSRYGILERPELVVSISEHILFDYDQTAIKVVARFDGRPLDPSATTPKVGSTFSSTVTLATRA
jgi:HK97 family phage major capsid protein